MRLIVAWLVVLGLVGTAAASNVRPVSVGRGINITAWFRFPASRDPAALANYVSDRALADLRNAGFDFVRLAIDPAVFETQRGVVIAAVRRIERQGLTVVVSPHPLDWRLEEDGDRLRAFWRGVAPVLRDLDPARTVLEIVNEPVFPHDPAAWAALQHQVLTDIRRSLPDSTVILTGRDWGSIRGLLELSPEADSNVLYSFHFYDPAELTSLAAYRPELDKAALAWLPFPVDGQCRSIAARAGDAATRELMSYYCGLDWDAARVEAAIDQAAAWAAAHHVRLIAGEFGASAALNPAARLAWLGTVRRALAAHGIGWALWGYDDVMGLAVSRPPGLRPVLDPAVLGALGLATRL